MDRPVFKVVIFSECVVLISGIGMAPPSGMGGSETSEYSVDRIFKIPQDVHDLKFGVRKSSDLVHKITSTLVVQFYFTIVEFLYQDFI